MNNTERVCLICSSAYVEPELEAEFGRLPPSFLPLGNKRLYTYQQEMLRNESSKIYLSLPEDFTPEAADLQLLETLGITPIWVPVRISLGEAIVYCINISGAINKPLTILYGDTLLRGLPHADADEIAIDENVAPGYRWGYVRQEAGHIEILPTLTEDSGLSALAGYISVSGTLDLVQAVTRQRGDFFAALAEYNEKRPFKLVKAKHWYDFGHVNTYFQSRQAVTTEREFNTLVTTRRTITKSGRNPRKIEAEANWFETLPAPLRIFTPAFLGMERSGDSVSYTAEYLHIPTLADLFVFGRLTRHNWQRIFESCAEFIDACAAHPGPPVDETGHDDLYLSKTVMRLSALASATGIDIEAPCRFQGKALPSLLQMATESAQAIPSLTPDHFSLVHGDFCFSNILYDFRANHIRVIDPRGEDTKGNFTSFGDLRYDIGKIYHSVIGRYDFIIARYYEIKQEGELNFSLTLPESSSYSDIRETFLDRFFSNARFDRVAAHAICIQLFLSMLPLHADSAPRQNALLANAMRLFSEFQTMIGPSS